MSNLLRFFVTSAPEVLLNSALQKFKELWILLYLLLPFGTFHIFSYFQNILVEIDTKPFGGRGQDEHGYTQLHINIDGQLQIA